MSLDPSREPAGAGYESPQGIEEWIEARLEDEVNGDIKRLSIPDLYDHLDGDWQMTLEAYRKLEALRAHAVT